MKRRRILHIRSRRFYTSGQLAGQRPGAGLLAKDQASMLAGRCAAPVTRSRMACWRPRIRASSARPVRRSATNRGRAPVSCPLVSNIPPPFRGLLVGSGTEQLLLSTGQTAARGDPCRPIEVQKGVRLCSARSEGRAGGWRRSSALRQAATRGRQACSNRPVLFRRRRTPRWCIECGQVRGCCSHGVHSRQPHCSRWRSGWRSCKSSPLSTPPLRPPPAIAPPRPSTASRACR
jgi:hypothetical protein